MADAQPQPQEPPQHPPPPAAVCPKLGADCAPCVAKTENCFSTFALEQSGHFGVSPLRTSSSKCDSHFMHTYS